MIVGMIPTYKEGLLVRDAIRSLFAVCDSILVFEGPIAGVPAEGNDTDFRSLDRRQLQKVIKKDGEWNSEVHKRNEMLEFTRRYKPPVWGIFLDADEILIWGEYIDTYIEYCNSQAPEGQENVACPILRVEEDGSTQKLTRIVRLDMLEKHILASSQWKFFTSDITVTFPAEPFNRQPFQGEPHVLHRPYLRPSIRQKFRLSDIETADYMDIERNFVESIGMTAKGSIPKVIDKPEIIVAQETGKVEESPILKELYDPRRKQ